MRNIIFIILMLYLFSSCGGHKSDNPVSAEPPVPTALLFPNQNAICISGNIISVVESSIEFKWNIAANADSYEITIKNLLTGTMITKSTNQTQSTVTLARNTPFSWFVTSKSSHSSTTAKSDVWKFYNAGSGITSYAPFPADNLNPATGQYITLPTTGLISLSWNSMDPDNDIVDYDIYFGTTSSPALYKKAYTVTRIDNIIVTPKTKYYWKITTRDSNNNTSDSEIVQFNTN